MTIDLSTLPEGLPRPVDDHAADHLTGLKMPQIALPATTGEPVQLDALPRRAVVFCYPMTGVPGVALPNGWNDIPGARGCSVQAASFRDQRAAFDALGTDLYGLSVQETATQREAAERLHLSFPLLSDADGRLTDALRLPTMKVEGRVLLKRLTIVVADGAILKVFYPVFPVTEAAERVLVWLHAND